MIVTSDFFDHWKTKALIELSGRPESPLWLMRLWAHCYNSKTTRFKLPDIALKAICCVPSEIKAEQWLEWLLQCRFIVGKSGDWTVYGFEDANAKLTACWANGRKAHRTTQRQPTRNPRTTDAPPTSNPNENSPPEGLRRIEGLKDREEEREGEKEPAASTTPPANPQASTNARPNALHEVIAYAAEYGASSGRFIPAEEPEKFFDHFSANGWRTRSGPLRDWRAAFRNWVRNGRRFGDGDGAGAGAPKNRGPAPGGDEAGKYVKPEIFK